MNKRNARQRLKAVLLTGGILLAFMVVALFIADMAIRHPEGTAAFSTWMRAHRSGWLLWRLCIYILLGWGIWRIAHAPGIPPATDTYLLRQCGVYSGL